MLLRRFLPFSPGCRARFVAAACCPFASLAQTSSTSDDLVLLPPFIVEERIEGPSWRYASVPGFEILTRCHDAKSRALAESFYRAHHVHRALLPARFEMQLDVPVALIFYDENLWPVELQESAAAFLGLQNFSFPQTRAAPGDPTPLDRWLGRAPMSDPSRPRATAGSTPAAPKPHTFLTDLRLSSSDSIHIFTLAPSGHDHLFRTYLRPTYLAQLLAGRTPSLPSWFLTGFLNAYGQMEFGGEAITLPPLVWLTPEDTKTARDEPAAATRKFLPLVDLLGENADLLASRTAREHQIAHAQLELLVRWALDPRAPDRRDRFWTLVERACTEPVTPELISTSLGLDPAALLAELAQFLPDALRHSQRWAIESIAYPDFEFRPATSAEIARLRGDWERLEARYAATAAPDTVEKYRSQSLRTLRNAYDRGEHTPALLAVLGLSELEAGNIAAATDHLAFATRHRVVRPSAYVELARLLLQAHVSQATERSRPLTLGEAREVLDLLYVARRQHPLLPDVFRLAAHTWNACATAPAPDDLAFLLDAPAHFPRSAELSYHAARFALAADDAPRAARIADAALQLGASDAFTPRLIEFRANLASPK